MTDFNTNTHSLLIKSPKDETMSEMIDETSLEISCKGNEAH